MKTKSKLYKVKLNEQHHAQPDQICGAYLKDAFDGKPAMYTRGQAMKKAQMFGGKIEAATDEEMYNPYNMDLHISLISVSMNVVPPSLLNKLKGLETYRDTVLEEHLYSMDSILEESNKFFTTNEKKILERIKMEMEIVDAAYFRIITN